MVSPRFNFVIDCTDSALAEYMTVDEERAVNVYTRGDLNWCLQTYHILANRSVLSVQCSKRMLPLLMELFILINCYGKKVSRGINQTYR